MKFRVLFPFILLITAFVLNAQLIHEPNNEIYRDIDRWLVQGYVKSFLPSVRP